MTRQSKRTRWIGALVFIAALSALADGQVVINEVGWSGTAASSSDEWIELYNLGDRAVDLSGWTLSFGDTTIDLGAMSGDTVEVRQTTIAAGGYLLLERTDDDAVADVDADVLYKGGLSNAGELLELRDADGVVVDRVDGAAGWAAGTSSGGEPPYASMERVDPASTPPAWASHDGRTGTGVDAKGGVLHGTPGRENSATILVRSAPRVQLLSPSRAGRVLSGTVIVEWAATDPDGTDEALRLAVEWSPDDGESWEPIAANLANGGSYAWDTTACADGETVRVRVVAEDAAGLRGYAVSPTLAVRNAGD